MQPVALPQQLGALTAAVAVTLSLVWAMSAYAYGVAPGADAALASHPALARACS